MTEIYLQSHTSVAVIFIHDVCIFVVFDFVLVHFYDPPISLIFQNPRLDHFVVDIVDGLYKVAVMSILLIYT